MHDKDDELCAMFPLDSHFSWIKLLDMADIRFDIKIEDNYKWYVLCLKVM